MVAAAAAEGSIRAADAVQMAAGEAVRTADAAKGGDATSQRKEEVTVRDYYYASDVSKLEDLLSKLNPSAEEFVPPSRRRGDGHRQLLSADAPVFVSPATDYYARHPPRSMHVPRLVGAAGGGMDSGSDGSANGQPNPRRRTGLFNQGRRRIIGGRSRRVDSEDSVRRTVYVADIDQHVTEQKLAEVFSTCGHVVDCRICGDPNSVLCFAFIEFADNVGAKAALRLGGTVLGFYPVKVLPSKTAILPVNPKFLPWVSKDEVKQFFEGSCGEVARLRLLGDYVQSTCIAFVEFVQADSAIVALNCSGMILGSLQVRVSPSKTPVRPRSSYGMSY